MATWFAKLVPETNEYLCVAYGNGIFVSVSSNGTNRIMRSTDNGENWQAVAAPHDIRLYTVTFGNGFFIASGADWSGMPWNKTILKSSDGLIWNVKLCSVGVRSITYGNGIFVGVGLSQETIYSNDNGETWNVDNTADNRHWRSVCYGNGKFVSVASSGDIQRVRTSINGTNWVSGNATGMDMWLGVTYGNGIFLAISSYIMRSVNGINWTAIAGSIGGNEIAYGNGVWYSCSSDWSFNNIYKSVNNGDDWTPETLPIFFPLSHICYNSDLGRFLAVCSSGNPGDKRRVVLADAPYILNYIAGFGGTISGTTPQIVDLGNNGSPVTAVPNLGYTFWKWSDGVTTPTRQDKNVTGNLSVTAQFVANVQGLYPTNNIFLPEPDWK